MLMEESTPPGYNLFWNLCLILNNSRNHRQLHRQSTRRRFPYLTLPETTLFPRMSYNTVRKSRSLAGHDTFLFWRSSQARRIRTIGRPQYS